MKKHVLFLISITLFILVATKVNAQTKALFVNDNGVFNYNTDTILSGLDGAGITYDIFNARDSLRSPTSAEMSAYQLVIWYCSSDGVGNYIWNKTDTDNAELIFYLETGGKLWLMGTDFMYDRYGSAPDLFSTGDFVYDYLGVSEYHAQSYGNDGGLGVAELDPVTVPFNAYPHDTIRWVFATAWWVDGCLPAPNAASLYNMGPASYTLQGLSSAVWNYHNLYVGQKELTFFFDPAIMDSYQSRVSLFEYSYLTLFMPAPPGVKKFSESTVKLIYGQNPAKDNLQCKAPESFTTIKFQADISDLNGKHLLHQNYENASSFNLDISKLSSGLYMLTVSNGMEIYHQKFVVNR